MGSEADPRVYLRRDSAVLCGYASDASGRGRSAGDDDRRGAGRWILSEKSVRKPLYDRRGKYRRVIRGRLPDRTVFEVAGRRDVGLCVCLSWG